MIYVSSTGRSNDNVNLLENYTVDKMKVINRLNFVFWTCFAPQEVLLNSFFAKCLKNFGLADFAKTFQILKMPT